MSRETEMPPGCAIICVLGVVGFIALTIFNGCGGQTTTESGFVLSKQYEPEKHSSGTGITGNGDVVFTSSTEDEQFILLMNVGGKTCAVPCSEPSWTAAEVGQVFSLKRYRPPVYGKDQYKLDK